MTRKQITSLLLLGASIIYDVIPADFIPDIPFVGWLDDMLVTSSAALNCLQQFGINPAFVFPAAQSVEATDILVAPWHAEINRDLRQYIRHPWPQIYATSEESDTVNLYMTDIQTKVDESATAFITGTRPMSEFEAYLGELDIKVGLLFLSSAACGTTCDGQQQPTHELQNLFYCLTHSS